MQIILILILVILIIVFFPAIISFLIGLVLFLIHIVSSTWLFFVALIAILIIGWIAIKFLDKFKESNYSHKKLILITSSILISVVLVFGVLVKTCTILIYPIQCSREQFMGFSENKDIKIKSKLYADRDLSFTPIDSISLGSKMSDLASTFGIDTSLVSLYYYCKPEAIKRNIHIGNEEFATDCTPNFNEGEKEEKKLYSISYLITSNHDESSIKKIVLKEFGRKRLEIKDFDGSIKYIWLKGDTKIKYQYRVITIEKYNGNYVL